MVKIQVKQIEKTYIPKYLWYKHGKVEGVSEWYDIDEEDTELVLDPYGNKINVTQKQRRDYEALALSVRSTA